ncbi:DUF4158 domain-containing protein [Nonomuraea rubra]
MGHTPASASPSDRGCLADHPVTERRSTPFGHQDAIRKAYALKEFSQSEADFSVWTSAWAWNTGDGKKTIFYDGVTWLRTNKELLPGVTTLARLVARVRDEATDRLYDTLREVLSLRPRHRRRLFPSQIAGRGGRVGLVILAEITGEVLVSWRRGVTSILRQ